MRFKLRNVGTEKFSMFSPSASDEAEQMHARSCSSPRIAVELLFARIACARRAPAAHTIKAQADAALTGLLSDEHFTVDGTLVEA